MYDAAAEKMNNKEYKAAIDGFTAILRQSEYYYYANLARAVCYEKLNKYDSALVDYNFAIAKNPKFYEAYLQRGLFYLHVKKDTKTALMDMNTSIELKNNYLPAYIERANLYFTLKEYLKSEADYTQAIALKPGWESYYKRAFARLEADKNDDGLSDLTATLSYRNDFAEAYYQRGLVHQQRGQYDKAIADYSQAMRWGYKNENILTLRADLYYQTQQYVSAKTDYDSLITGYKKRTAAIYSKRGICFTMTGDSVNAQKDFTRAISLNRSDYAVYLYRAENAVKLRRLSQALADYRRAIELNPKAWDIYFSRAKIYMEQKKFEPAKEDLDMAIKYNKEKFGEGYYLRGSCKDALKDVDGACADLKKAASMHYQEAVVKVKKYCGG
jgi:tetratricopeptide (TPR) repeat protein